MTEYRFPFLPLETPLPAPRSDTHLDCRSWRTGPWLVDAGVRALYRDGLEVAVPPRAMACLLHLVANHHRAVARDELIDAVWGHAHLSDGALAQTIFELRGLLADGGTDGPIRSIRGFGYRWVAPAEEIMAPGSEPVAPALPATAAAAPPQAPQTTPPSATIAKRRLRWRPLAVAAVAALAVMVSAATWLLSSAPLPAPGPTPGVTLAGTPAATTLPQSLLVRPVNAGDDPDTTWMRLGLMDLIASRLRAAGATTVPLETALALDAAAVGDGAEPAPAALATTAVNVVTTRINQANGIWVVHIESGHPDGPSTRVLTESADAVAAAREAADRLALALGLAPAPVPAESAAVLALLQQVDAALLERDLDRAEHLVSQAEANVRAHPRLRMAEAAVAFHRVDLALARERFEALLASLDPVHDPRMWARARTSLASVYAMIGEPERTRALLEELAALLDGDTDADLLGVVQMNLGLLAQERGDLAAADRHLVRARHLLIGVGDLQRQSVLASNLGVQALRSERLLEAGSELERALAGFAALGDRSGISHVLAAKVELHLASLDLAAADKVVARLQRAHADSPLARAYAQIVEAMWLLEHGRLQQAATTLASLQDSLARQSGLAAYQAVHDLLQARLLVAQRAAPGTRRQQAQLAREQLAAHRNLRHFHAEAWQLQVQATLDDGDLDEARRQAQAFLQGSENVPLRGVRLRALAAGVAVSRASGDLAAALSQLDQAWALLDDGASPGHWLQFADMELRWLASLEGHEERLLRLAQRLEPAAGHHFGAARARVLLIDALGPAGARPAALQHLQRLAGERPLPVDLDALAQQRGEIPVPQAAEPVF